MPNPFVQGSPHYYQRLRAQLSEFRREYIAYINRTAQLYYQGKRPQDSQRPRIVGLATLAAGAVSQSGVQLAWLPPPAYMPSTPPLVGLSSVAFAHESEVYRGFSTLSAPKPFEAVIDAVDQADVILAEREAEVRRKRKNPLHWIDRGLRLVLGLPAYLVSLVGGFDLADTSTRTARALWIFSLISDGVTVFVFGASQGWWG